MFVVALNWDYHESMHVFRTLSEAIKLIRDEFNIASDIDGDSVAFWQEVDAAYSGGKWKGLQLVRIDPLTLETVTITAGGG